MLTLASCFVVVAPALLVIPLDGRPVRFGASLPAAAVATGLRLEGRGLLQWRRLPVGGPDADPVWVELAISGPPGTVRLFAGGAGPNQDGRGPVFVREVVDENLSCGTRRTERLRWHDGSIDELVRIAFTSSTTHGDESFSAGEALTSTSPGFWQRAEVVCRLGQARLVEDAVMPQRGGGGGTTKALRAHLSKVLPHLRELPGARGAGDYARSGGVVTNLEFDTTLALLRCALGLGDGEAWARACRAAMHLVDRDLDLRSGLPFLHGKDHRTGQVEPGHAWLTGLLFVGLLAARDDWLLAAQNLGKAVAAFPPVGQGRQERLRDYAWPLLELETLLTVAPDRGVERAADRLASSIARRFDATLRTFRFGEGEVGGGVYFERGWLLGGLLLPALRAHLARRPDRELAAHVAVVQAMLLERLGSAGRGLPTHWRNANGVIFAEHREEGTAAAAFVLEALPKHDLERLLRRSTVRAAIGLQPNPEDPDLATQLTLLARCRWVWR